MEGARFFIFQVLHLVLGRCQVLHPLIISEPTPTLAKNDPRAEATVVLVNDGGLRFGGLVAQRLWKGLMKRLPGHEQFD